LGTGGKSLPELVSELKSLTVDYAKQETLAPLKGILRYVIFGLAAALTMGVGLVFWIMAALRALQNETGTAFEDHWSWAPYFITLAGTVLLIGLAIFAIGKEKRRAEHRKAERHEAVDA